MIDYEYLIERDEGDRKRQFRPNPVLQNLPNLAYIEGPNSSGKSTLLHILALSCHGLKNKRIKKSLQEKMENLINSEHQEIKFKITITNKDAQTEFTAEKKNFKDKEIVLRNNMNQIISYNDFERDYNLIYDIPEDPTKRLKELTHEIKDFQNWFQKRLGMLRNFLVTLTHDIREAKDPRAIENNKLQKKEVLKQKESLGLAIKHSEDELKSNRMYACLRFYTESKNNCEKLASCLKDTKREDVKSKKERLQANKEAIELQKRLHDEADSLDQMHSQITPVLVRFFTKKEDNKLKLWRETDVKKELLEPEINQVLKLEASYFRELIEKVLEKERKDENLKQAEFIKALFQVVESYSAANVKLPGIELTVAKFKDLLKTETRKYDELIERIKSLENTSLKLKEILEKRKFIVGELIPEIKRASKKSGVAKVEDDSEQYRQQKLIDRMSELKSKVIFYRDECIKVGIPERDILSMYQSVILGKALKNLEGYDELQLKDKIYGLEQYIAEQREKMKKIESISAYLDREIERLESKKEHPYLKHLTFLELSLKQVQSMEDKINTCDDFIRLLIDENSEKEDLESRGGDAKRNEYFKKIFTYLAQRVGTIRHIEQDYKPTYIDLIRNEIITEKGRKIKIADMGTGQSQSAFLKGLLSSNDGRKIVALFDEVAMLDKSSLDPVKDQLKSLYMQGRLLLGIIVQKGETLKAEPLVK